MAEKTIALLGQPNSGKSTLFNGLTGSRQHVGNWPGKTVERKDGFFSYNDVTYKIVDLPGTYSLSANSDEEVVTRNYISSGEADLVCILADASQLNRSLFMLADYAGIHVPVVLLLNTIIWLSVHMNFSKSRLLSVRHVKFIADFVEIHRLQTIFCCFFSYFSLMFTIFSGYNVHMILK